MKFEEHSTVVIEGVSLPPEESSTIEAGTLGLSGHLVRSGTWLLLPPTLPDDAAPGVVQVGVNDLGWVVYQWTPGP